MKKNKFVVFCFCAVVCYSVFSCYSPDSDFVDAPDAENCTLAKRHKLRTESGYTETHCRYYVDGGYESKTDKVGGFSYNIEWDSQICENFSELQHPRVTYIKYIGNENVFGIHLSGLPQWGTVSSVNADAVVQGNIYYNKIRYRSDGGIDTVLCTCVISEKVMLQGHAELYDVNK